MRVPTWLGAVAVLVGVGAFAPATLPYEAYFYADDREPALYFVDRPGASIYALGPRPFFLLGRHGQHRVTYDLNTPRRWTDDPAGFVLDVLRCVQPTFLILPEDAPEAGLTSVSRGPGYVVFENRRGAIEGRCDSPYVMQP